MFRKKVKLIFSFLVIIFVAASFYFAQISQAVTAREGLNSQLYNAGDKGFGQAIRPGSTNGLPYIIQIVISAFLGLLGVIFLVLIIYAGFEWMTAQGDEEKVTKAKDTLQRAIIGLVIITAAYSITYFVFNSLSGGGGSATSANPLINTGGD